MVKNIPSPKEEDEAIGAESGRPKRHRKGGEIPFVIETKMTAAIATSPTPEPHPAGGEGGAGGPGSGGGGNAERGRGGHLAKDQAEAVLTELLTSWRAM